MFFNKTVFLAPCIGFLQKEKVTLIWLQIINVKQVLKNQTEVDFGSNYSSSFLFNALKLVKAFNFRGFYCLFPWAMDAILNWKKKTSSITSFLIIGYHKIKFPWADNLLTQTTNIYPPPPQALLYVQNEPSNLISVHVHWLLISSNFLNEYKIDWVPAFLQSKNWRNFSYEMLKCTLCSYQLSFISPKSYLFMNKKNKRKTTGKSMGFIHFIKSHYFHEINLWFFCIVQY